MDNLRKNNPNLNIYRLLRTGGKRDSCPLPDVYHDLEVELLRLKKAESAGEILLDETIHSEDPVKIMGEALSHLSVDQSHPAVVRKGDRLFHKDRNQLLYYGNRLSLHPIMEAFSNE